MFATNETCFRLTSPGLFVMNVESFLIWTVGLDRCLLLKMTHRYEQWNDSHYLTLMISPAVLYAASVVGFGYAS